MDRPRPGRSIKILEMARPNLGRAGRSGPKRTGPLHPWFQQQRINRDVYWRTLSNVTNSSTPQLNDTDRHEEKEMYQSRL